MCVGPRQEPLEGAPQEAQRSCAISCAGLEMFLQLQVSRVSQSMIDENRQLVTDEPVEVQDCRKITDQYRGIYRIYPNLIKECGGCQHVTGWTCKYWDLNRLLCPTI